jgi:hypothetical protein
MMIFSRETFLLFYTIYLAVSHAGNFLAVAAAGFVDVTDSDWASYMATYAGFAIGALYQ